MPERNSVWGGNKDQQSSSLNQRAPQPPSSEKGVANHPRAEPRNRSGSRLAAPKFPAILSLPRGSTSTRHSPCPQAPSPLEVSLPSAETRLTLFLNSQTGEGIWCLSEVSRRWSRCRGNEWPGLSAKGVSLGLLN